jgi:hypothetical protein
MKSPEKCVWKIKDEKIIQVEVCLPDQGFLGSGKDQRILPLFIFGIFHTHQGQSKIDTHKLIQ